MMKMRGRGEHAARIDQGAPPDGAARGLVWSVFLSLLVLLVWQVARASSRIPLAEDWLVVAPLTGREPDLLRWLWAQNNEHRLPLARLLLLVTLEASGGDYRVVHLLNVALLAAAAAGLVLWARVRRGRTDPADAFFPLVLLHFGHSNQVLFAWQISFVVATVLTIAIGCALFTGRSVASRWNATVAGTAVLLLPLCGANGLLFVPAMAGFLGFAGWASWAGRRGWLRQRGTGLWLQCSALAALGLSGLYFVGYQQPWWNPPSPGVDVSFKTALKVLALGFGPAAQSWWTPAVAAAVALSAASFLRVVWSAAARTGASRDQAIGAALFLANTIVCAGLVGWARAGYVPEYGIPIRYVLPAVPAVVASYLTWEAFGPAHTGRLVQRTLAAAMLVLLPLNTLAGHRRFADWYRAGMARVEADLNAGTALDSLAIRHREFLVHWWTPEELERHMRWLHEAGIPPFDRAVIGTRPNEPR